MAEPNIVARFNFPCHYAPHGRLYVHGNNLQHFGRVEDNEYMCHPLNANQFRDVNAVNPYLPQAVSHFKRVFDKNPWWMLGFNRQAFDFMVGIAWATGQGEKMIDWLGYRGFDKKNWPGNPEISVMVTRNGKIVRSLKSFLKGEHGVTCRDGSVILGLEGEHQLGKGMTLDHYINNPPKGYPHFLVDMQL
ncbi:Uncharacterised protein [uncultured archaeon]|nr:Uncharacterised protein [uncultured archaeon]